MDVIFEWKTIGQRLEVVSVSIRRADLKSPITAGDIRSIPFSIIETMRRKELQTQPDLVSNDWLVVFVLEKTTSARRLLIKSMPIKAEK